MFWIAATVLMMIVMLAVYVPLNRAAKAETTKPALMRALAAELNEVNQDKGLRFANAAEAEGARAEIGRRLLALEAAPDANFAAKHSPFFAVFALVPILAIPLYMELGQPEYADQHFAMRMDRDAIEGQNEVAGLVERVEQRLKEVPEDSQGWGLIAPIYYRMGRVEDALSAYERAIKFFKGDAVTRANLIADRAEILVAKDNGKVSADAAKAFNEAVALDKDNQKALFYLAINLEQSGKADEAKTNWQNLIARFRPANPAWIKVAENRLVALGGSVSMQVGPTPDQVDAAADMTLEQRQDMIKGMVDGLAAKLKDDPKNVDGWLQLIRSRQVLGDSAQTAMDLASARAQFVEGSPERASIDALATSLGI
jgi:cytochrome c-type biogenesis protein CcmH